MGIHDLATHFASVSAPGFGALLAAWFAWRMWRRLVRAVMACAVVGLVVWLAFPGVAHQLVHDMHPAVNGTADH